ncbi:MAG: TAT-variant-translocated molybdopterin oxidoreductase, partial [Verrucomicrobia bacterium]|nr:TAT-variant-translocated molybdopterin oxidoreductase [Verrucomicrobiota bacterium]
MNEEEQRANPEKESATGRQYWRSLDEFMEKPAFKEWLHREFPEGASEAEGVNRRHFLKIMAASFAMAGAGAAGCRRPEQYILPYSQQPEGTIPGIPVHFTTSYPSPRGNLPLIVETHQHRPTHVEGNPEFAPTGGAVDRFASASVLNLYDPDRMTSAYEGNRRIKRERVKDILAEVAAKFGPTNGQGLAVLAQPSSSPTRRRLKQAILEKYPRLQWAEYEAVDQGNPERAAEEVWGSPLRPQYLPEKAKRILAVDSDFLYNEPDSVALARSFARSRKVKNKDEAKKMSRLYAVEPVFTTTGAMADHRLRLGTAKMTAFLALLAAEVLEQTNGDARLAEFLRTRAKGLPMDPSWVAECARDLVGNKGASVVIPGSHLPEEAQQLVFFLNEQLGAVGETVLYRELPAEENLSIRSLAGEMENGTVETLLILGGNPAYDAPADLEWTRLQKKVPQVIRYGYYFDETSLEAQVNIAAAHYLESWGDGRAFDGTYLPVQPMILPLFDALQELELLALLAGMSVNDPYGLVLETFRKEMDRSGEGEKAFQRLLSTGFLPGSAFAETTPSSLRPATMRERFVGTELAAPESGPEKLEIRLLPDPSVGDGFHNNNGWLQECPDPMTKLTWDNAVIVSPALAGHLGFDTKSGDFLIGGVAKKSSNFKRGREESRIVELTVDGITVRGPVHILPGMDDWTVALPLGYGRRKVGRVGEGTGFDAYPLSRSGEGLTR